MDQHLLQGWQADPFGLHEQRYFSAGRPTKLVRDGRVEAYDEPLASEPSPDGVAAAASVPAAGTSAAGTGLWESDAPGVYLAPPASAHRDAAQVRDPAAHYRGVPARRRRTGLVNAVVALVAIAAVLTVVAIEGGFSPQHAAKGRESGPPSTSLAAFVTKSARSTLARQTADLTIHGTIDVGGTKADLQGTGQTDFTAGTVAMHVSTSVAGTTIAESEIVTSQFIYEQLSVGGQSFPQVLDGKHWFGVPLAGGSPTSTLEGSPTSSLQMLEQQGAQVTPLGTQDVGGRSCAEYTVQPSEQAMLAAAQQEWAKLGLSSSERAAAQQELQNFQPPIITVWFDPTTDLACQLDVYMQFSTGDQAGASTQPASTSAEMLVTFTDYGVPVDITPPAPADTLSLQSAGQS